MKRSCCDHRKGLAVYKPIVLYQSPEHGILDIDKTPEVATLTTKVQKESDKVLAYWKEESGVSLRHFLARLLLSW